MKFVKNFPKFQEYLLFMANLKEAAVTISSEKFA